MILEYPGGPSVITKVLMRGRREALGRRMKCDGSRGQRESLEDATLLTLKERKAP